MSISSSEGTSSDDAISSDRWEAVLSVFHDALAHPPDERSAYVRDACGEDTDLRQHVERLLEADATDNALVQTGNGWNEQLVAERSSMSDVQIGPYRIREEIGRGGMGVVYRAERDDVGTTVAIKVLRERFPTADRLRRFLAEQRTLGRLNHPSIARFLDAGVTGDGTPFFVMEHVDGAPITAYCDRHDLGATERLTLFQDVCEAVRYAHANLVVHRDLKPSNVLVTTDGQVKLLDFGVAKGIADDVDDFTRTGERLLTPAYAAPEQVRDEPVSTATDVYALGALLYELLTGRRPLDVSSDVPLSVAIERIMHDQPVLPSEAASQGESPPIAPSRLRGDLDTICQTALQKAPDRRYASAEALRDDLWRTLSNRPIAARPDSWTYRIGKFLRRNRTEIGATGAATLGVALLVVFYTLQLSDERDRAGRQAAVSESVVEFLVEILEEGNPNAAGGDTLTIYDVIERAEMRSETLGDPLVRANVLDAVARVRLVRGQLNQADSLFRVALDLRQTPPVFDYSDIAASLNQLAQVQILQGNYPAADSLMQVSLGLWERAFGAIDRQLAEPTKILAHVRYQQGDYAEADSLYQRATEIDDAMGGLSSDSRADAHQEWGMAKFQQADYEGASRQYREAIDYFREMHPEGHVATASALANLASIERVRGNYEAAVSGYREAMEMTRTLLGPRHINIALIQNNLAVTYHRQGQTERAASIMTENLQLREDLLGANHPAVATAHNNLGDMLRKLGRLDAAERHFRTALLIREAALGPDHARTATTLNNIASLHESRGSLATAEPMRRDVLTRYRAAYGEEHPRVALALSNLGSLLRKRGAYAEADSMLTQALDLQRRLHDPMHDDLARTLEELAALHVDRETWSRAEPLLQEALAIRREGTPDHWETAWTAVQLGDVLMQLSQFAAAESLLISGVANLRAARELDNDVAVAAESTLTVLYDVWERPEEQARVLDSLQTTAEHEN